MAIYKNREVQVVGPSPMANTPSTINVSFKDGTHENVKLGDVRFTEGEKKALQKQYPSRYDNVQLVTEDDLTAVRVGVAPSYDKATLETAKTQALHDKQVEVSKKRTDELKAKQKTELDKTLAEQDKADKIPLVQAEGQNQGNTWFKTNQVL